MERPEKVTAKDFEAIHHREPYNVDKTNNVGIIVTLYAFWIAVQQSECKYSDACKFLMSKIVFDDKARGFENTMRILSKALSDFRARWPAPSFSNTDQNRNRPRGL